MKTLSSKTELREWFGASRVVDAAGQPLVVYHGTDQDFEEFDPERGIGGGSWFTNSVELAGVFVSSPGGRVILAVVKLENPLVAHGDSQRGPSYWAEMAKDKGHDGLIFTSDDYAPGERSYVAFSPDSIRSATGLNLPPPALSVEDWAAGTLVVGRGGVPRTVYHGTLSEFDDLDAGAAAANNDLGNGIYFTSSETDARVNYATEGPEAERKRNRGLPVTKGRVLSAAIKLVNPVIMGGKGETVFSNRDGSLLRASEALRDAVFAGEPQMEGAAPGPRGGATYMIERFQKEAVDGQLKASEFADLCRRQIGLDTAPWGSQEVNRKMEYVRQAFVALGYDGIIDRTAGKRFVSMAKHYRKRSGEGSTLAHTDPRDIHYVAFNREQIRILSISPVLAPPGEEASLSCPLMPPVAPEVSAPGRPVGLDP